MSARARACRFGVHALTVFTLLASERAASAQPVDEPLHFDAPAPREARPTRSEGDRGPIGPRRLAWRWNRFNTIDYASTAMLGAAYFYIELRTTTPIEPRWTGGILFDDGTRDVFVARTREARGLAGRLSDWFTLTPQIHVVVDSTAVPLADGWNVDVAWQMMAINLQAQAITGLVSRGGHRFVARERPDVSECREDDQYHERCFGGSNASFPSGHTSGAFVGAALVCAHHAHLPLYGEGPGGAIACGVDLTMATTSGLLRMIADRHYVSDVIAGAAIGLGAGLGVPFLLHYREPRRAEQQAAQKMRWTLAPLPHPDATGLGVYGWF